MSRMINIVLNGERVKVPAGTTVLEAARNKGIDIPTLCRHEALDPAGFCRLCIVEVDGPVPHSIRVSCVQEVQEGLVVATDTERIRRNRKLLFELLLARASENKQLIDFAAGYGVTETRFAGGESDDCIRCGLCVRVCRDKVGAHALCFAHRGFERRVTTEFERLSGYCIGCGSCAQICPTGAIRLEDRGDERRVFMSGRVLARFKLERCDACGRPFAPEKFLDHICRTTYKPLGMDPNRKTCPDCARKSKAPELAWL